MARVRIVLIAVSVALLGFAPAPLPRQQRQRQAPGDVTGTWELVLWEESGQRWRHVEERFRVEITKDSFALVTKGQGQPTALFTMRLEPTRTPPAFTWSMDRKMTFVGSYRLRDGELTLILTSGDRLDARPTDFGGKPQLRIVLRRVKR